MKFQYMIGITPLQEVTPIRINIFLTPYNLTIENHKTSIYIVYLRIYLNSQFHIFNNNISGDNLKNVKKMIGIPPFYSTL